MHSLQRYGWKFPPLRELAHAPLGSPLAIECPLTPPAGRTVLLKSPLLFRRTPWNLISKENAIALCAAVRQLGAAISVPISIMEQLPASAVPVRIAQTWTDRSPDLAELEMSDIIEFNFCSEKSALSEVYKQTPTPDALLPWPIDVVDSEGLARRVSMLREITDSKIPIGFALPVGNVFEDVSLALACSVDYVVLSWSPNLFDEKAGPLSAVPIFEALAEARRAKQLTLAGETSRELKIVIDAPLSCLDDFAKLFALGANAWCGDSAIENLLRQTTPSQTNVGYSGMLTSYSAQNRAPSIQPQIAERLLRYQRSLEYIVARAGKTKPSDLTATLLCDLES